MDYAGSEGASVYAEAKGEYTRQLCQYLSPALQKYFLDLLEVAKEREADAKKHLVAFQTLLEGISEWNIDKVQRETQSLAMSTQCDYLEELLTAVFIAHTKVLSAIRLTNRQKKLQITIPKLEHFLHRTLTECARLLWTNTFLFATSGTSLERQKNMRQIEGLIGEGILQGVRTMLPVKSILREYLAGDETDEEEEEEEDEEAPEPVASEPVVQEPIVAEPVVSEPVVEPPAPEPVVERPKTPAPEPVVEPPAPSPAVEPTVPTIILDDKPRIDFSSPADDLFKEAAKGLVDAEPELAEAEPELEEAEIPEDTGAMEATAPADEEILDGIEFEELS
jgi:SHS2 domain-containing protein